MAKEIDKLKYHVEQADDLIEDDDLDEMQMGVRLRNKFADLETDRVQFVQRKN